MFRLRSHTASAHKMKITEYKNRFGADLDILEVVFHRSLIMVDNIVIMIVKMVIMFMMWVIMIMVGVTTQQNMV